MNQVLNLVKVYTFVPGTSREFPELAAGSGSSGSKVESTSKSISEIVTNTKIMAQFQMDHSLINKPLQLSITLPHHISTGKSDKKILFFAVNNLSLLVYPLSYSPRSKIRNWEQKWAQLWLVEMS